MRVQRHSEPMSSLDVRCIVALRNVRGMSSNAQRIHEGLDAASLKGQPITVRQRFALYSICWRFRRQLSTKLMVKVTIALADAKAAAEELHMEQPPAERIRGFRVIDGTKAEPPKKNPLDDLFPETVAP